MPNPAFPYVSCICPSFNRRKFLPYLLHIFDSQDWPKDARELIIIDDSPESNQDIIDKYKKDNTIRYIYSPKRISLGKKRNMLNNLSKGEYIICFDDDDFYPPNRIKSAIQKMKATKNNFAGSSILYVFVTSENKIYKFGPYGPLHCTNGTMAYHRNILKDHSYEKHADKAEEKFFLKNYTTPLIQLEPMNVMLCISHDTNTVDKRRMINSARETNMKLKSFIKDKKLLDFYQQLVEETKNMPPPIPLPMPEINNGELNLDAIENGYVLVPMDTIENALKNKNNPDPIQYRLQKILNKMEKGEIKCFNPYDVSVLNLDKLMKGEIAVAKDYVIRILENLKKTAEPPIEIIKRFEIIKDMHNQGNLPTIPITAINQYTNFEFAQNTLTSDINN